MTTQDPPSLWTCPLCREPLLPQDRQFRCANGHCFDQAKEGYVNLLPTNRKGSAAPGDNREMLRNRREFLQLGHYRPLADALGELCREQAGVGDGSSFNLLDTGCGEGYYTGVIAEALLETQARSDLWLGGIDIAKEAARMAAKRYPNVQFAVASNADLPLANDSLDCALRIFAPAADGEIVRALKPGGLFIAVTPGERHLFQLRQLVYDAPREHAAPIGQIEGLNHVRREAMDYRIRLTGRGQAAKLLAMTPYYWQASREKQEHIAGLEDTETEIAFRVDCYRA